jgi:hypothetical protein
MTPAIQRSGGKGFVGPTLMPTAGAHFGTKARPDSDPSRSVPAEVSDAEGDERPPRESAVRPSVKTVVAALSAAAAGVMATVGHALLRESTAAPLRESSFVLATMMVGCAIVLDPAGDHHDARGADVIAWSTLVFGGAAAVLLGHGVAPGLAFASASTVALLLAAFGSATHLLGLVCGRRGARCIATVAIVAAACGPLWLGPLALRLGTLGFTNAVVALSPLSYLAAACEWDYLRSPWFYLHSPVGSLRFAYPAFGTAALALSVFVCAALSLEGYLQKRKALK